MPALDKIRRLREMSWAEMRFRAQQQLRIAQERWKLARNGTSAQPSAWAACWDVDRITNKRLSAALGNPSDSAADSLVAYFLERVAPRFYFHPAERELFRRIYAADFPGRIEEIRKQAEALCAHRFRIFAYPEANCGPEIPWRRDLVHGTESGLGHWSQIPYLDFSTVGDSKIAWEPNRHQHFFTLGQAYFLTGEERFAEECLAQWEHWQRENPYLRGINWASSLEVAFRSWSWLWAAHLLLGSRALTGARLARMVAALAQHAEFIARNLSTYFSPNTHLLGEGFALFAVGLLLPELRGAQTWRETGREILAAEIGKQVRPDGSHAEQSTCYHRYATDFFLCAAILAEKNGCPFLQPYREQLAQMVDYVLHTAWPSGRHPMVGDADGGQLLLLGPRDPNDQRATLSTAAIYFERGVFERAAGKLHEETLWLLGADAGQEFASLEPCQPMLLSRAFPGAGCATMRNGWDPTARFLLFDAGPQGMDTCGHGHADALSIVCSADGVDWLIDAGTFVYTSSGEWRDFFRSTRAHNTVVVDGRDQAEPAGFFKWGKLPHPQLERTAALPGLDWAVGQHDGYSRLASPVTHRRSVIFVKPDYWLLIDEFLGSGRHKLEFCFHFPPHVELKHEQDAWRATSRNAQFALLPLQKLDWRVARGETAPAQGWYSEDYGHREPAPALIGAAEATLPASFVTLLWPGDLLPQIRQIAGTRVEIATQHWTDQIVQGQALDGELHTDAELAFLRTDAQGGMLRAALVRGTRLVRSGVDWLRIPVNVDTFEVARTGNSLDIDVWPDPFQLDIRAPGIDEVRLRGKTTPFTRNGDWIELRGLD